MFGIFILVRSSDWFIIMLYMYFNQFVNVKLCCTCRTVFICNGHQPNHSQSWLARGTHVEGLVWTWWSQHGLSGLQKWWTRRWWRRLVFLRWRCYASFLDFSIQLDSWIAVKMKWKEIAHLCYMQLIKKCGNVFDLDEIKCTYQIHMKNWIFLKIKKSLLNYQLHYLIIL